MMTHALFIYKTPFKYFFCFYLGNKGNTWLLGQIEIPAKTTAFQVVFEGVNGNNYRGDIGIDDIDVNPWSCATAPGLLLLLC